MNDLKEEEPTMKFTPPPPSFVPSSYKHVISQKTLYICNDVWYTSIWF